MLALVSLGDMKARIGRTRVILLRFQEPQGSKPHTA
jgi:hypothetical protein